MRLLWLVLVVVVERCHEVKAVAKTDKEKKALCREQKYVWGKDPQQIMGLKTKSYDYGLVEAKEYLSGKPTGDFQFLEVRMQFGSSRFYRKVWANALDIPDDNHWHQLWIDLEPTDLPGLDNWHIYMNVDGKNKVDIDTGYKWHWKGNHPKNFSIFAAGKSIWIPRANATVCNALEASSRLAYQRGTATSVSTAWLVVAMPVLILQTTRM